MSGQCDLHTKIKVIISKGLVSSADNGLDPNQARQNIWPDQDLNCLKLHKIRKALSKFYYRLSELIVKYNIGLKTLL